jgi:hypothetical protein
MKTKVAIELRRAAYEYAVDVCARPVIIAAREIGCTTGAHLAAFLNDVGVHPPHGESWTKNSANRAVGHLIKKGLIKWARHRGKRKPALEAKREAQFEKATRLCRVSERYAGH